MFDKGVLPRRIVIDTNLLLVMLGLHVGRKRDLKPVQLFKLLSEAGLFPGNLAHEYSSARLEPLSTFLFDRGTEIFSNSFVFAECKIHNKWKPPSRIAIDEGFLSLRTLVDDGLISEHDSPIKAVLNFKKETKVVESIGLTDVSLLHAATTLSCALMTEERAKRKEKGLYGWAYEFGVPILSALDIPDD